MFQRAAAINLPAAYRAASWGGGQIMGFNARDAGFADPVDMVRHMAKGADHQLGAFVQLIEGWGLDGALRGHDWTAFARRYNGTGQIETYARRMESAHRRHAGKPSPVVLRLGDRGPAVRELQRALDIRDDGAFGPETLAAVRAFRKAAGLAVDGIVGAMTWAALQERAAIASDLGGAVAIPAPPAQPTRPEIVVEQIGMWTGAAGALTATAAGAVTVLGDLTEAVGETGFLAIIAAGTVLSLGLILPRIVRGRA